jgi:transcriptional regulator with XRE-family HTH domain
VARKKRPVHANITRLREAKGLTLTEFAAQLAARTKTKVDKTRVWHWENGDSAPNGRILPAVAAELDTTIDDLLGEGA